MKKISIILGLLLVGVLLVSCDTITSPKNSSENVQSKIKITDLDDAYDMILNSATAAFIGYHNIDEGFLSWLSSSYGEDKIKIIAGNGDYKDPSIWYSVYGKSIHVLWLEYCQYTGVQFYCLNNVYKKDCASSDETVLDFTGDLNLADDIATTDYMSRQKNGLKDCFSVELLKEMKQADIFTINNEFTYTTRGEAIPNKAYTFRANPNRVKELSKIGMDLCSLANNHVCDYGKIGLTDTFDTLNQAKIPYVGAGKNLDEAEKIVYFVANGRKIAIVSATQIERSYNYTKEATADSPGVLKTLNPDKYCAVIKAAKKNADIVIAICHWGTEGDSSYASDQVKLANDFVDAGADVIIGGHTHCLQGIEYIGDVPVFYSLGNYWFSSTENMPDDYDTGLAQIRIAADGTMKAYFVPCKFSKGVTSEVIDVTGRETLYNKLRELSKTVTITEDGELIKK